AFAWWKRAVGPAGITTALLLLALDAVVGYGVIVPNWGNPTDMYGFDNSISHRLLVLRTSPLIWTAMSSAIVGVAVAAGAIWKERSGARPEVRKFACVGGMVLMSGAYLAWEVFFYNGRLPTGGVRYDFPSQLIGPLLAGAAFFLVAHAFAHKGGIGRQIGPAALGLIFVVMAVIWSLVFTNHRVLPIIGSVSHANTRTRAMMTDLAA